MKKYMFEAPKTQWEKPTEPDYLFCAPARTWVLAASEKEARELARKKLAAEFDGSGCLLGEVKLTACHDLPADWSYGYGDERRSGPTDTIGDLTGNNVIR